MTKGRADNMIDRRQHLEDGLLITLIQGAEFDSDFEPEKIHLDQCDRCQDRMEELAADRWLWKNSKSIVRSTAKLLDGTQAASPAGWNVANTASPTTNSVLSHIQGLLDRASHPEMLGRLGQYEIESIIGQGGMGVVLKGFDTELRRVVAIKMLLPHFACHGAARKRFLREARAAAAISHKHIVEIYQVHSDVPHPYLVMALIPGDSLQTIVEKNGPMSPVEIVQFSMQIAEGLAAAHEQGLVHRDIKPANILLEAGGNRALITDFGLARTVDEASLTCTGLVAGTPHYMSPEQCNGRRVDSSSDLFSLGCLMYFMATGRPPFRGETALAVMNRICTAEPRNIREINPEISKPLANLIHRLLEKRAGDRMESASRVATLLKSLLVHLQQPETHAAPEIRCRSSSTRKRRRTNVLAVLVALILVFAAGAGVHALLGGSSNLGEGYTANKETLDTDGRSYPSTTRRPQPSPLSERRQESNGPAPLKNPIERSTSDRGSDRMAKLIDDFNRRVHEFPGTSQGWGFTDDPFASKRNSAAGQSNARLRQSKSGQRRLGETTAVGIEKAVEAIRRP